MKTHIIAGGGNVPIHVVETGDATRQPILFIHGFSQSCLSWVRQLRSDLATTHRVIAMDMRGHGLSGKPRDAYGDSKLWADDVNAVIRALELDRPILSGWSYGPLVILDYIRHYGDAALGGIQFVGGVTRLGSERALSVLRPAFLGLTSGFFSNDPDESTRSLESLIRLCIRSELSSCDLDLMMGCSTATPAYVRKALFSRAFHNDDLLAAIRTPVLITHGTEDAVVDPAVVEQHKAGMPHAQIHLAKGAGHAVFWDDAPGFNERLRQFSASR
jgi:non-heme chloroperoxidase